MARILAWLFGRRDRLTDDGRTDVPANGIPHSDPIRGPITEAKSAPAAAFTKTVTKRKTNRTPNRASHA